MLTSSTQLAPEDFIPVKDSSKTDRCLNYTRAKYYSLNKWDLSVQLKAAFFLSATSYLLFEQLMGLLVLQEKDRLDFINHG